jgi:hypothetical protein
VTWRDGIGALVVALVAAALGAPLGLLWTTVGPHVDIVMTPAGPDLANYNTEAFVGGDLSFAAITLVTGALLGGVAYLLRRWRGPLMVVGLALGCVAGAWITWKLGARIGLAEYERLIDGASVGQRFEQPMKLRAEGLLFLGAIAAVIVYVANAAWSHRPNLGAAAEPDPEGWHRPPYPPAGAPPATLGGTVPATPGGSEPEWGRPPETRPGADEPPISSGSSAPASPPAAPAPPADGSASSPPA